MNAEDGWLLTAQERGNPATRIDSGREDGVAWCEGNRVRPLIHGATYFARLLDELRDCHEGDQIYLAVWRGDPGEQLGGPGTAVVVELGRAASAGAQLYGLVWRSHLDTVRAQARENKNFVRVLRTLGASLTVDQRVRKAGSHHQKFVVIRRPDRPESDVAFVGGIDLSFSRRDDSTHAGDPQTQGMAAVYGPTPPWHDAQLEIHGPAVADVEECFRERWDDPAAVRHLPWLWIRDRMRTRMGGPKRLPPALPPPPQSGTHTVQLLRTYPNKLLAYPFAPHGERSVARGYRKALTNARRLIYVEDQFLWSPLVATEFARVLRDRPQLRMIAVVPAHPDSDARIAVGASNRAQRRALQILHRAAGDRFEVYSLENEASVPVYVHAKICLIDDVWAAVGSANLNRRSWTHDSELTAAVLDETTADPPASDERRSDPDAPRRFARDLRLELFREHLGLSGDADDEPDLVSFDTAAQAFRCAADALETWHVQGQGARPSGRLRPHATPTVAPWSRWWAAAGNLLFDPDGRSPHAIIRHRW